MNRTSGNPSGIVVLDFQIDRQWEKTFEFYQVQSGVTSDLDITAMDWEFFVSRYPGDRKKQISLTIGSGLEFVVYNGNAIQATVTSTQSQLTEGLYYYELYCITEQRTYLSGDAEFSYRGTSADPDSGTVSLTLNNDVIQISLIGGGFPDTKAIGAACSDESTALTAGTAKVTFRMPFAMTVTAVRASLGTAQASGNIFTVDINESGTSILSTKITIDNNEKTSVTAATQPVISDASIADDAEITVDIDQIGNGTAKGLKVWLIGR